MSYLNFSRSIVCCAVGLAFSFCQSNLSTASEPIESAVDVVDLFPAANAGAIEVRFIPSNAARANVLLKNTTNEVIHVRIPDAFAAVPVLAQFGGQGFGGQGFGGQGFGQQGGQQGFGQGQGFGQQGGQGGSQAVGGGADRGNQQIGGFMRIAPQKTRKFKATTVCLEHGKPDPNPRIAYKMLPIDEYTSDARVAELCAQLGHNKIPQKTAQAAAWHLANQLEWNALAKINKMESRYLGRIPFFNQTELERAKAFVESLRKPSDTYASR